MNNILRPFMFLGFIGAVVSLAVNVSTYLPNAVPLVNFPYLAFGVFPVWLATVLVARELTKDFKQREFWKAALRGAPQWLRRLCYASFVYAGINFIVNAILLKGNNPTRVMSGHVLPFYLIGASTIYSYLITRTRDSVRRCPQGHPVSPAAEYCERCGTKIVNA